MRVIPGRALALGLALAASASLAPVLPAASAHNEVLATVPAAGEVLTELPESFEIRTSNEVLDVGGTKSAFIIQDADGLYYGDGCVRLVGMSMFTTGAVGAPGTYTATWQLVSADGHTIDGSFEFEWQPTDAASALASEGSASMPQCGAEVEPEPSASAPGSAAGDANESDQVSSDVWWILAAVVLIVIAVAVTLLASRRPRSS